MELNPTLMGLFNSDDEDLLLIAVKLLNDDEITEEEKDHWKKFYMHKAMDLEFDWNKYESSLKAITGNE